jgi:hypothetical protein
MTPTATKVKAAKKKSASVRLEELQGVHDRAKADLAEANQRAHEHRGRIQALRARLLGRTIDNADEFTDTGLPKKGTDAEKIAIEIADLADADSFATVIAAAETRLERARLELRKHVEEGARELLTEMAPDCHAAVAAYVDWAQQDRNTSPVSTTSALKQPASVSRAELSICAPFPILIIGPRP